jgi:D-sedoheptulose 7-phosphate isomerase
MTLVTRFQAAFIESIELKRRVLADQGPLVTRAAETLAQVFKAGGKVLLFGNGGSAADAQHLAAEFVNRFKVERPPGRPGADDRHVDSDRGRQRL